MAPQLLCYALSVVQYALSITAEELRQRLGAVLRWHREEQGRRLSDVAAEAGCSPAYLSEVERGRKDVSSELLVSIAYALGVPAGSVYAQVAEALSAPGRERTWPVDPRRQLRKASAMLDAQSLRTVANFSAFLATTRAEPARRRIGFVPPSAEAT